MSHAATVTTLDQPSIRAQYDRDGYLALNNITSAEEVARIRSLLDPLYARFDSLGDRAIELSGAHRSGTPLRSPEINDTATLAPALKKLRVFERCRAIASELLGAPAGFLFDHAIYKLPQSDAPTHWHQDEVYAHYPIPLRSVHFWIPLQEATVENGCMWYIPGTHDLGLVRHVEASKRYAGSSERGLGSTVAIPHVDETKAVPCPVPLGGIALHHPLTFHCAGANRSNDYRRAWILHFGAYGKWRYRLHPKCIAAKVRTTFGLLPPAGAS